MHKEMDQSISLCMRLRSYAKVCASALNLRLLAHLTKRAPTAECAYTNFKLFLSYAFARLTDSLHCIDDHLREYYNKDEAKIPNNGEQTVDTSAN